MVASLLSTIDAIATNNTAPTVGNSNISATANNAAPTLFASTDRTPPHTGLTTQKFTMASSTAAMVGWDAAAWTGSVSGATLYHRFYLWISAAPGATVGLAASTNSSFSASSSLRMTTARTLAAYGTSSTLLGTATTVIPTGQWARIETKTVMHSSVGTVTIRIYLTPESGTFTEEFVSPAGNTLSSQTGIDRVAIGSVGGGSTATHYFADSAWSDTTWVGGLGGGGTADATLAGVVASSAAGTVVHAGAAAGTLTATGTASALSTLVAASMPYGRNQVGIRGVSQLMLRIGRGVAARSVSVPLPADTQMSWTAPGGDDVLTATVPWPDRGIARPDAFTTNMPVRVEDRRSGEIVWEGRLADPGLSGNRAGQEFRLSATGAGHDLDEIMVIKNYVDRDPDHWTDLHSWSGSSPSKVDGAGGFAPHTGDALQIPPEYYIEMPWPAGTTMATSAGMAISYLHGFYPSQDLDTADGSTATYGPTYRAPEMHGVVYSWMSNQATNNHVTFGLGSPDGSAFTIDQAFTALGVQTDVKVREGSPFWPDRDYTYATIKEYRVVGATASNDVYVRFANLIVIGKRYDRYGVDSTGVVGRVESCSPSEIVEDMLGTILQGRFDPGQITTDLTILMDQFSFWSPTAVSTILDAAAEWNANAWWGVWARANPDALPRMDYRSWNVAPRYTLDDTVEVQLAGGGETWVNSALINWLRGNSVPSVTRATISVPAVARIFGTAGTGTKATKTRDIAVDLTSYGPTTKAKAIQLATEVLSSAAAAKMSGSAVVHGPLMDDANGRPVQPWEIRPGWPVLVGSTPGRFSSGATLTLDGESTFRLTKVTYSASDDSSSLEFDGGTRRLTNAPLPGPKFRWVPPNQRAKHRTR